MRPITRDARLPALHRGDFGLRSRASLTGIASGSVTASSSRPGRSARRAGSRTSQGGGCESPPRDATPRSVFRCASRTRPLVSKAGMFLLRSANRSQEKNALCSTKKLAVSEGRRLALTQAASSSPPARDSFKTKAWGCLSRSVRPSPIEPAILGRLPCAAQGETVRRRNGSLRTQPFAMPLLQRITSCCAAPGKRAINRLHFRPAPRLRSDEPAELGRQGFRGLHGQLCEAGSNCVGLKRLMDSLMETANGIGRRAGWNNEAEPLHAFQSRIARFFERGHIRKGSAAAGSRGDEGS